jgi:hypothetical protein
MAGIEIDLVSIDSILIAPVGMARRPSLIKQSVLWLGWQYFFATRLPVEYRSQYPKENPKECSSKE